MLCLPLIWLPLVATLQYPASNLFLQHENLTVHVFASESNQLARDRATADAALARLNFSYGDWDTEIQSVVVNVTLRRRLWLHTFVTRRGDDPFGALYTATHEAVEMTTMRRLQHDTSRFLLVDPAPPPLPDDYVAPRVWHVKTLLTVSVLDDFATYAGARDLSPSQREYYTHASRAVGGQPRAFAPVTFLNDLYNFQEHFVRLNESASRPDAVAVTLTLAPQSMLRWQWMRELNEAFTRGPTATLLGDEENDMRRMFLDVHPYLLYATSFVSVVHLLFDFLAFKNDVAFWRARRSFAGLSLRYLLVSALSQWIVALYLYHENTSRLVLVPAVIGALVEMWKASRAFSLSFDGDDDPTGAVSGNANDAKRAAPKRSWWQRIRLRERQQSTSSDIDAQAWRVLGPLLLAALLVYSTYMLVWTKQKGWFAWILKSAVGLVYGGGFVMMTPQLFINYRLKSVAHLPWRVFGYKAANTFIDDLFAFVIKMPTMHRMAVFRDDIVFVTFMIQRAMYPVDPTRADEYGQTQAEAEQTTSSSAHQQQSQIEHKKKE